jgi:hypothetical protein
MYRGKHLSPCLIALVVALSQAANATEIIDSQFSTCTTIGCQSTSIASWAGRIGTAQVPWTAKFLAVKGNCLRLEMTMIRTSANLEMVVIAPNALTVYRNDQGGTACTNCSLIKINPAPSTGYYTAVVSTSNGAAVDTDFHLRFGQYDAGNPNCATPTPKLP